MVQTQDWLPLGSVVHVTDLEGLYFIIGFMQMTEGGVWDYGARPYPMGFMGVDHDIYFNREDIDGVYALGYQDMNSEQYQGYLISQEPLLAELKERVDAGESVKDIQADLAARESQVAVGSIQGVAARVNAVEKTGVPSSGVAEG